MAEGLGDEWDRDRNYQSRFLVPQGLDQGNAHNVHVEEARTTPLFSVAVARRLAPTSGTVFRQYGLLAQKEETYDPETGADEVPNSKDVHSSAASSDRRIFVNLNAPFSAFICGSQGSGKSHTLSCMLEGSLMASRLGKLPRPLKGIVFHWDKHTAISRHQPCEAAYLCSPKIPVTLLVSASNYWAMKKFYENLPGLKPGERKPIVRPLLLQQKHLNVDRMMTLMSIDTESGHVALYTEVNHRILRKMAMSGEADTGLDYPKFRKELKAQKLFSSQNVSLDMRFQLLESLIDGLLEKYGVELYEEQMPTFSSTTAGNKDKKKWRNLQVEKRKAQPDMWTPLPGSLTIVDLSDRFVDENSACALFDVCLSLFLENQPEGGAILALDEAHKFMSGSDKSLALTDSLLSAIRLQRHLGTRVVISTQEPTISPKLLDLSSINIVYRFSSPAWMAALRGHLAAASNGGEEESQRKGDKIFKTIVDLEAGQALLFSPSAMLDAPDLDPTAATQNLKLRKLGLRYVKMRVRQRLTTDGGRSLVAV
ncbi:MAG: hypothetical protein Q9186_006819 [Xanthomendoza sp. 1 TL-2023]